MDVPFRHPDDHRIPAGGPPNTVNFAPFGRRTGFQPVREDSASRLSANETTGWKPVGQDRWDGSSELAERTCHSAKLIVLGGPPAQAAARLQELENGRRGGAGVVNLPTGRTLRSTIPQTYEISIIGDNHHLLARRTRNILPQKTPRFP